MGSGNPGFERMQVVIGSASVGIAMLTAVAGIWIHFDNRLDELENNTKMLIGADGEARPSTKALQAIYMLENFNERIMRLEKIHDQGH